MGLGFPCRTRSVRGLPGVPVPWGDKDGGRPGRPGRHGPVRCFPVLPVNYSARDRSAARDASPRWPGLAWPRAAIGRRATSRPTHNLWRAIIGRPREPMAAAEPPSQPATPRPAMCPRQMMTLLPAATPSSLCCGRLALLRAARGHGAAWPVRVGGSIHQREGNHSRPGGVVRGAVKMKR